ncbi:NAD(P)/FAD-dependent oxidoreductase [Amphritea sp. HPY]|uniref:NAD(P)/FAD-dependent oxidoreductase n=1 Tax=Amphritea sp. HPY TaxID=3421652 RepID=UPI003D7ED69B
MPKTCIIIGASHAAAELAPSLRQEGWDGRILIIGDESYLPYHRPTLSKAFLSGEKSADDILIRPEAVYEKNNIEFMLNVRVDSINRADKTITLNNGEILDYDKLALCTGSRVRTVPLSGIDLPGIHYLRDLSQVEGIMQDVGEGKHAIIVGGGYIGLETASVLRKLGMEVTVLEMAPRVLARVTAPEVSEFYSRMHAEEGVTILTDVAVSGFEGDEHVSRVICSNGETLPANLVIVGVGILPNVEIAQDAGLEVDNGIIVDEYCLTSDPDIVAAGDCTSHPNALYNQRIRLESVPNASEQGKSAAASICGNKIAYQALPWFWSDQFDVKLRIAGLSQGYDEVVIRGNRHEGREFTAFYLKEGKLIAADCINTAKDFMISKALLSKEIPVTPEALADESFDLKQLLNS